MKSLFPIFLFLYVMMKWAETKLLFYRKNKLSTNTISSPLINSLINKS